MALANFLKMEIEVVCVNEDSGANHVYGEGPRTLKLICVPLNLDSADGQIRWVDNVIDYVSTLEGLGDIVFLLASVCPYLCMDPR